MQTEDQVFDEVCNALGFTGSSGFLQSQSDTESIKQKLVIEEAKEKLGIDAVYFIQTAPEALPVPVIYFKKLKRVDFEEIMILHRKVWNQGRIPLLFIITPGEVRIYDCFEPPPRQKTESVDSGSRLITRLESIVNQEQIRQELTDYAREKLDAGGFWVRYQNQFNAAHRADQHLLRNLRVLREELIKGGLDFQYAHSLIGRSIFILYLEDRGALDDFFRSFEGGKYGSFKDVLENMNDSYKLFTAIGRHFNGDLFPVTDKERTVINQEHLLRLKEFLEGTDLQTGQTLLWPYSFDVIPIEFISSIYEEFFYSEKTDVERAVTHYTPSFLVEFLLDQVLPNNVSTDVRILDPACGSGIFLVTAFRRIIASRRAAEGNRRLRVDELKTALQSCVFGVDINSEAIRVAAFSLYLTLLDYIEPKSLMQHKQLFPQLIGRNLFVKDFFDSDEVLAGYKFDYIVGNTPWESKLGARALAYCRRQRRTVGDRQVAQAFLWKVLDFAKPDARISLIVTAKGLLFNRNHTNRRFRREFFNGTIVQTIINFSALRHDIFEKAVGPAAAVIYSPRILPTLQPSATASGRPEVPSIVYVVPKPSLETRKLGEVIVDHSDIKEIPVDLAASEAIWKNAMWGTRQDWELLTRLGPDNLRRAIRRFGWTIGEGFRLSGRGNKTAAEWLTKYRFLPVDGLHKFEIDRQTLEPLSSMVFGRPRSRERFKAPMCLIKEAPRKGAIVAALSYDDLCFNESIISVGGRKEDIPLLKALVCILNSSLAQYFLFLTASKWGVERDDILVDEFCDVPFPQFGRDSPLLARFSRIHDQMVNLGIDEETEPQQLAEYTNELDEIIFETFHLSARDREVIKDRIKYDLDFFQNREDSIACKPVNDSLLLAYGRRFKSVLGSMLENKEETISATIYSGSGSLVIASFELGPNGNGQDVRIRKAPSDSEETLAKLRKLLREEISKKVYFSRILTAYEGNKIYLVKPNETRYWTRATAYDDADLSVADILESWRDVP
jgi:methylase of polypeptide subunit release factors